MALFGYLIAYVRYWSDFRLINSTCDEMSYSALGKFEPDAIGSFSGNPQPLETIEIENERKR